MSFGFLDRLKVQHTVLATVVLYMSWVRSLSYDTVVRDGGVLFLANDPWYHARAAEYVVENYPAVFNFDPWTYFPYGSVGSSGFGGLFTQSIATVSFLIGLGNPSTHTIELVTASAPVFFGVATAIPVYYLSARLTDRWTGLLAPLSLSLFTGQFLRRTTFGNSQHESAEAFFVAATVLLLLAAIRKGYYGDGGTPESRLRNSPAARLSVIAGAVFGAYVLTWPPAVYLVVPIGAFVVVQSLRDHYNGTSPRRLVYTVVPFLFTACLVVLGYVAVSGNLKRFSGTSFSSLQPVVLGCAGAGTLLLSGVSGYTRSRGHDRRLFYAFVALVIPLSGILLWLTGLSSLVEDLVWRMFDFGLFTPDYVYTVAETQPATVTNAIYDYGLLVLVALVGLLFLGYDGLRHGKPGTTLVFFWSVNMFTAYFTQQRFGYYLAVAAAVLVAYCTYRSIDTLREYEAGWGGSRKTTAAVVVFVLVVVAMPVNVIGMGGPNTQPGWRSVDSEVDTAWHEESLPWLRNNTPDVPMRYNRAYSVPDDGDFDYPVRRSPLEGVYGVMSWWSKGHWITHAAERIPNANPFQQGVQPSAEFFVSQTENRSDLVLEALPSIEEKTSSINRIPNEELRSIVASQDRQERYEDTRYVVIDDKMASSSFASVATWAPFEDFVGSREFRLGPNRTVRLPALNGSYDETTLSRLYYDDADGMGGYRLVYETETYSLLGNAVSFSTPRRPARVNSRITRAQYDETGPFDIPLVRVSDLPERRAIQTGSDRYLYDLRGVASVKVYERVEGARITGSLGDNGSRNVTAILRLRAVNTARRFTYTQETSTTDGSFTLEVPYHTKGNIPVDEGGTDSNVKALGSYSIVAGELPPTGTTPNGTGVRAGYRRIGCVDVSETQVLTGGEVELNATGSSEGGGTAC
jgi:dolichyl-diphosphooligosaccharide--protein glycosyltransferase